MTTLQTTINDLPIERIHTIIDFVDNDGQDLDTWSRLSGICGPWRSIIADKLQKLMIPPDASQRFNPELFSKSVIGMHSITPTRGEIAAMDFTSDWPWRIIAERHIRSHNIIDRLNNLAMTIPPGDTLDIEMFRMQTFAMPAVLVRLVEHPPAAIAYLDAFIAALANVDDAFAVGCEHYWKLFADKTETHYRPWNSHVSHRVVYLLQTGRARVQPADVAKFAEACKKARGSFRELLVIIIALSASATAHWSAEQRQYFAEFARSTPIGLPNNRAAVERLIGELVAES